MRISLFRLCLLAGVTVVAAAQGTGTPVQIVTPVFHQLVLLSLPSTFDLTAPEQSNASNYLHEIPLRGQTVEQWTQLVTVSGYRDKALDPAVTPALFADRIATGFKGACPQTFAMKVLPAQRDGYAMLVGCGSVADEHGKPGATHSEIALILVLKGTSDLYTVQWAERTPVGKGAASLDEGKWLSRLKRMQPIKLCPLVAGEKAPYPSCLAQ